MLKAAFFTLFLAPQIAGASLYAQDLEKKSEDSKAVKMARELGTLAGAAKWCEIDKTALEDFNTWAEIEIAVVANGDFDKVSARIRFNDTLMISSTKKPAMDCKTIGRQIQQKQASSRP